MPKIQPLNLLNSTHDQLKEVSTRLVRADSGAPAGMSAIADVAIQYFLETHEPFIRKGRSLEQVIEMAAATKGLPDHTVLVDFNGKKMSINAVVKKTGRSRGWVKRRIKKGVFQN